MSVELDRACCEILARCACEALRRTSRAVTALYQESLRDSGVRATQLPILVAANLVGPVAVSALAQVLVMDRTTLTRNLKALEQAALVTLEVDDDRRVRLVVLTAAGRTALESAVAGWYRAQAQLEASFGDDRVASLVAELGSLTAVARSSP